MKFKNVCLPIMAMALVCSCQKEEDPNNSPEIKDLTFNVSADLTDTDAIGSVGATDADGDVLTYGIINNDKELFKITEDGQLWLAKGKSLDIFTVAQHMITVTVWDGETTSSGQITINVKPVDTKNVAPTMLNQEFSTLESIHHSNKIGMVHATDLNFDALKFEMVTNDNDLFTISEKGRISLAEGKSLHHEEAAQHTITVRVSDNEFEATAEITISVRKDKAPIADPQEFNAAENISHKATIGNVFARDPERKNPSFSLKTNDNGLFEITKSGELSLVEGKVLDFENAAQHQIIVAASDGYNQIDIPVTVIVEQTTEE